MYTDLDVLCVQKICNDCHLEYQTTRETLHICLVTFSQECECFFLSDRNVIPTSKFL